MTKIGDVYFNCVKALKEAEIENPAFDAKILFETAFDLTYSDIILNPDIPVDSQKVSVLEGMVRERICGRPLQYIIGCWDFMGFEFKVGEGVLIPRPETEQLVEYAVEKLKPINRPVVFDLCSGSGCIGLSIKKLIPSARVFMVEKSRNALEYLCFNRENLGVARETSVIEGDIFNGFDGFSLPEPDAVLSNPPYVRSSEMQSLQKEVRYEPEMALDGGEDGLIFYRCLSEKWLPHIKKGGFIAVECGEDQGDEVSSMFSHYCDSTEIINDFASLQRIVAAVRE